MQRESERGEEEEEIMVIKVEVEGFFGNYRGGKRCREGMQGGGERGKKGGVVYQAGGWETRERGKEKTRLPQHDLQIALSPWRLLSAPLSFSIQSGRPNSGATIWGGC